MRSLADAYDSCLLAVLFGWFLVACAVLALWKLVAS